ncbi:MAG: hypothetical protein ACFFC7_35005, partial [Candidatus Hermodarchaeota archaeon]
MQTFFLHRILQIVFSILFCFFPFVVLAQNIPDQKYQKVLEDITSNTNELTKRTVDVLKYHYRNEQSTKRYLDRVHFVALPEVLRGGNARAIASKYSQYVVVDAALVLEIFDVSKLIVIGRFLDRPRAAAIIRDASRIYGAESTEAHINGKPLPPFRFNEADYLSDEGELQLVERLHLEIADITIAWVILHELAHHMLGHTLREPINKAQSRNDELAADAWAFKKLTELGICLWGVGQVMSLWSGWEQAREILGIEDPEEESSHPSWRTRYQKLTQLY